MSLARVSLGTELALLPFKRYMQQKPDNYQEAVQRYCKKLNELYQSHAAKRQRALLCQKESIQSETFRLDLAAADLDGITVDRKSLPHAETGDRVVLTRQDAPAKGELLVRGTITRVGPRQVRIKFDQPILKKPTEASDATRAETGGAQPGNHPAEDEADKENTHRTNIDFRIKFDTKRDGPATSHDSRQTKLIEAALINFNKLKCNQAVQRILLGFYDERLDTFNDKARVMTFTELVPKLNHQQRTAIEQALKRRFTLVEGPAGTGKSIVGAHIAASVARQRRGRVLICSPIKETVDRLTELIDRVDGIRVVKLPADKQYTSRASSAATSGRAGGSHNCSPGSDRASHCRLDKLVEDEIYLQAYARSKDIIGNDHDKLHAQAYRMVLSYPEVRRRELETKLVSKASVVCCQIDLASGPLLRSADFDMLILDDVQATSELDCLIAIMTKGVKQVVLLSDTRKEIRLARILKRSHSVCQSNNTTGGKQQQCSRAKQSGTSSLRRKRPDPKGRSRQVSDTASQRTEISPTASLQSISLEPGNLFERLLQVGLPSIDLRVQYRCHATLSNFVIHHFYAGRLRDDTETNDKMSLEIVTRLVTKDTSFSWLPNRKYLTAVFRVPSQDIGGDAESANSRAVQQKVNSIVEGLAGDGVLKQGYRIGVIHNSTKQAELPNGPPRQGVRSGTADKFVGQECDFVILVANKNDTSIDLGQTDTGICSFIVHDFRRCDITLNWALTRARLGLFIVLQEDGTESDQNDGRPDHQVGGECGSWRELVKYYAANGLIV